MSINTTEIARICNVSRGTVDRALNGRGGINPDTKALILRTAKEMGYIPHLLASSLSTGKSYSIGIVVFDLNNRYFGQMVTAIQQFFLDKGIFCYICISNKDKQQEISLLRDLISRNVGGIILMPINGSDEIGDMLLSWRKPVVTVNNRLDARFPFIGGNNEDAVYEGMRYFYTRGYRELLFLCPPYRNLGKENLYAQSTRVDGFHRFLSDHPDMNGRLITDGNYTELTLQAIAEKRGLGVFCSSDYFVIRVYKAAREKGLRPPEDFGLMGFDGADTLDYLDRRITTLDYPAEKIGEISAGCLHAMMNGACQPQDSVLNCPVIQGETL